MNTSSTTSPAIKRMVQTLASLSMTREGWSEQQLPRMPAARAIDLFSIYGSQKVAALKQLMQAGGQPC